MSRISRAPRRLLSLAIVICACIPSILSAQQFPSNLYSGLRWRLIGPFRGGRSNGVTGVPGQPETFYFGAVGGGVWKSQNAGRTWTPVFDSQPIASIGAIAVAPSKPDVVYVGSGEADMRSQISFGNGMYKSIDAGKTWAHIGLDNTRQIGRILVDPQNPDLVYVAALGHAYGANPERGVYRSQDGGATWQLILHKSDDVGAIDLAFDPQNSRTIYATLWNVRRPPWSIYPPSYGPGSGIFKSSDGGDSWQQLTQGLPTERVGRIGIAVAPSNSNIVYAIVDATKGGIYRSDDAGASWRKMSDENRIWTRGWYFSNVVVDPRDPETVYVSDTSVYRSTDGGKTWIAFKGAPGGDDYHQLWIYPDDPKRMILASDQGTIVSVDGGVTWSSWYNQSTAQLYHVAADYRFPSRATGSQQDSGAMTVPTNSGHSEISMHDWSGLCVGGESGYTAPDPLHPEIIFGDNSVERCNLATGEVRSVSPELSRQSEGPFRRTWTLPLVFSEADPHALYFSDQFLFKTIDGGNSWAQISTDLTREDPGAPPNLDAATIADAPSSKRRGVIYTIAPSPIASHPNLIWVGTDDGYIQVTPDGGKSWRNATPKELTPWSKVVMIQASHFDAAEAYAAVDRHRLEDNEPYIFRTRDSGKTWQQITSGLPAGVYMQTVKEDPKRKGLLFAGTELGAYVSFDDGDNWQSLQLNLPPTSMRDFAIHGDDLIVATHGRGFWVLDDITPLRQLTGQVAQASAHLFRPADAIRMHAGADYASPTPKDEALAENPPAGAMIDYYLKSAASAPVVIEIFNARNELVRRYSSDDHPQAANPGTLQFPAFWRPAPPSVFTDAGMHRWIWDLHYAPPPGSRRFAGFDFGPAGVPALPGAYTVKLTVNGDTYTQPLNVKMDPRSKISMAEMEKQFNAATQVARLQTEVNDALQELSRLRNTIPDRRAHVRNNNALVDALDALERKAGVIVGAYPAAMNPMMPPPEAANRNANLTVLVGQLTQISFAVNSGDSAPTMEETQAISSKRAEADSLFAQWSALKTKDLAAVNDELKKVELTPIVIARGGAPEK